MTVLCCCNCGYKTESGSPGHRCGVRISGDTWCDGVLVMHQDGDCQWCLSRIAQKPERDALWCAIYAAEFVRRVADAARRDEMTDEMMAREGEEAKALADWHHEAVPKAER